MGNNQSGIGSFSAKHTPARAHLRATPKGTPPSVSYTKHRPQDSTPSRSSKKRPATNRPRPATATPASTNKRPRPATNRPGAAVETPVRPCEQEWLQIYSPTRTPASIRMKVADFAIDGPTLGEGSFAKVKLATHLPSRKKVAVKIINKAKIPLEMKAYAATEPGILCGLKHSNVVKLMLTHETEEEIFIFLQFMAGQDMHSFVQQKEYMDEADARTLFVQMLDAVGYIHKEGVVHRDIKLENMLISNKKVNGAFKILLIDFGFAALVPHEDYKFSDFPGSVCYAAPELLRGKPYDGTKVDVYALGVTLYTMLHGRYPFYSADQREVYNKVWYDPVVCASDITEDCADLLRLMLSKNPDERPSIQTIKSHRWMKDCTNPITKKTILNSPVVSRIKEGVARMSPTQARKKLF